MRKFFLLFIVFSVLLAGPSMAQKKTARPDICLTINPVNKASGKFFDTTGTRGMADVDKRWDNGQVLRVKFLNGPAYLRAKVMEYAKTWEQYANVKFQMVESGASHIRVQFNPSLGSYSNVGTDASDVQQTEHTMNLGIDSSTDELYIRRATLHEFGHSLGLLHEHMSPISGIQWNKQAVYKFYIDTAKWTKEKVDFNLFYTLNESYTNGTYYDPYSIMHYPISPHFTTNGFGIGWNTYLSDGDRYLIGKMYPKVPESYDYSQKPYCSNFCSAPIVKLDSGLVVYPIMQLQNASLRDIMVLVYFSDSARLPLKDINGAYVDRSNNQVCSPRKLPYNFYSSYPVNSEGEFDFGVFLPYKELHLKKGMYKLKYDVKVYSKTGDNYSLLFESKYYDVAVKINK